eukprot:2425487-Rhodomonas_salina.1
MALSRGNQIHFFLVLASCHFAACELVGTSSLPGSPSLASKRSTLNTRSSLEISDSESLLRLRGGSTSAVSEARLKAQAQALAAVKAKASQMGAKKGATAAELTTSTAAAAAAAAAASPAKPAPTAAPPAAASVSGPTTRSTTAAPRPVTASPVPTQPAKPVAKPAPVEAMKTTSTVSPSDFATVPPAQSAAPKPRVPMPVVEPDSDTSQLPGGEEPVQAISGAGSVKKVTDIAQKNRLLVMQCKALRARATDPEMKKRLDARIFELEAAWQNYVKVDVSTTQHSLFAPKPIKINRSPSELVLDERTARRGRTRIPVTFTVRCPLTQVGEKVLLLGDAEELGSWNPLAAVPLETTNNTYPLWHAT